MSKKQSSLKSFFQEPPMTSKKRKLLTDTARCPTCNMDLSRQVTDTPSSLCIICGKQLFQKAMKPLKLLRHLETKQPGLKDKAPEYFERKKHEGMKKLLRVTTSVNENVLRASYFVPNHVVKAKKPITTGEESILPSNEDICLI